MAGRHEAAAEQDVKLGMVQEFYSGPVRQIISAVHRQMMIDFEAKSAAIQHSGERGTAREDILRQFLESYLPERFGIAPGFVIDVHGQISNQMDLVIFDKLSCPKFKISDRVSLFPVESVAAAISVKSRLTLQALREANLNLQSVVGLDRFGSNRAETLIGGVAEKIPHEHDEPVLVSGEPVFTAIFAFDSPNLKTVGTNFAALLKGLAGFQRVQLITILNQGTITFVENNLLMPSYSETADVGWFSGRDLALPTFYSYLMQGIVRKVPLGMSFTRYLNLDTIKVLLDAESHVVVAEVAEPSP